MEFLLDVTRQLFNIDVKQNPTSNGKRMLSAIVVASCLHDIYDIRVISTELLSKLLSLFRLMPDVLNKKCEDWELLNTSISESSFRKKAFEAICELIHHRSCIKPYIHSSWLCAIPTAHFLSQDYVPFQSIELDERRIKWKGQFIDLTPIKKRNYDQPATQ